MTGKEAISKLRALDYSIALRDDDRIKYRYQKGGNPPLEAPSILEVLQRNKHEAVSFLGQENIQKRMLYEQALEEINREYHQGTINYVKTAYLKLWDRIVSAEDKLTQAWLSGGAEEFHRFLGEWSSLNLQAIEIFQSKGNKK